MSMLAIDREVHALEMLFTTRGCARRRPRRTNTIDDRTPTQHRQSTLSRVGLRPLSLWPASPVHLCVRPRPWATAVANVHLVLRTSTPAIHFASTVGKPRDQPRFHRCNPSTSTTRSAFAAVSGHGGARIVAVSSPPSDPSDGRGDAPKANPPRAAADEYGLNGSRGAAHIQPGRL